MNPPVAEAPSGVVRVPDTLTSADVARMFDRYGYSNEAREIIRSENLLPKGLLSRLQATYPQHSGLMETEPFLFRDREYYSGIQGFREVVAILGAHGIELDHLVERELFVEVYRFKATQHILNSINWANFVNDPMYQLVMPQPGMMHGEVVDAYKAAATEAERRVVIDNYMEKTLSLIHI